MKSILGILMLLSAMISCTSKQDSSNDWEIALRTAKTGEVVKGSKEGLVTAIRNGAEVRIGWGSKGKTRRIEHLSDPIWLAVLNEQEVMAHLDPQVLSKIDWDNLEASYADPDFLRQEWRVVITTKGSFDAVWYDRQTDSLIRRVPQNHAMTWFVKYNRALDNQKLFDETP